MTNNDSHNITYNTAHAKRFARAGAILRAQPLHLGGASMLDAICENAEQAIIGVGSANKHNVRNPFTAEERIEMLDAYLRPRHSNYRLVAVPDFAHIPEYRDGTKWKEHVVGTYGDLDCFISGNEDVTRLLGEKYQVIHPAALIPHEQQVKLRATQVRIAMAQGREWRQLVPEEVAQYIEGHKLDERFRKEFGLQTLAYELTPVRCSKAGESETAEQEHRYAMSS
jgi:nicotinamide-nucleotide adenylyltransferase